MSVITTLKTRTINRNPNNPRKEFDQEALEELAASIKEHGLLQPPVVYSDNGKYTVVCGERRLLACKAAKIKEIPCIVIGPPATQERALQLSLVENLQREDLKVSEEAPAIKELVESGLKKSAIAVALGKSPGYVNARYQIARYPEVLEAFVAGGEEHIAEWAQVGQIETDEIRARVVESFSSRTAYGIKHYAGELNDLRKIEKRSEGDIEERMLTTFCQGYHNKKAKVEKCIGDGYGAEREACKHYADVSYLVCRWLGREESHDSAVCLALDRKCMDYKRDREKVAREKLEKIDPKRLLKEYRRYMVDKTVELHMTDAILGRPACKDCPSHYSVPNAWCYSRDYSFSHPYEYCLSDSPDCFEAKAEAFKKEVKRLEEVRTHVPGYLSYDDAKEKKDGELQELAQKVADNEVGEFFYNETAVNVLGERGLVPSLKVEWAKFEPPEACSDECYYECGTCARCPDYCPHQEKGMPKEEVGNDGDDG